MDFQSAWHKARKGQQSGLFASESAYNYPHTQRTPVRRFTDQQKSYQRVTYHPQPNPQIWSEYSGVSSHRTPGVSMIVMEANSRKARMAFTQAEYTLSKLKEKGW